MRPGPRAHTPRYGTRGAIPDAAATALVRAAAEAARGRAFPYGTHGEPQATAATGPGVGLVRARAGNGSTGTTSRRTSASLLAP